MTRWMTALLFALTCIVFITGCPAEEDNGVDETTDQATGETEEAAEETGEAIEDAADATGDALKDAADATGEAIDDGIDATGKAVEDAGKSIENLND